jgi:GTP-binding protein HflX
MIEKKSQSTAAIVERAILVSVVPNKTKDGIIKEHLDELAFLASTAGVVEIARFTQKLDRPDRRTYVGKGKLADIAALAKAENVDMIIADDDLSPSQTRNLEAELNIKILDRSLLILEIFSSRAQTAQAKTQVELAQYKYLYPRLTRLWTHLTKQKGGVGMRGPGEKELETDRRIVQDRISFLKEKLAIIDKQSATRRQGRDRLVRVALVGYTNVGKSTLMNVLSKSEVLAENKLFATVDSTVRKIVYEQVPFLLTDTVGFIRKLPTHLIESFKSTLDEVREADILLHVVDASHPYFEQQIQVVNGILKDMNAIDKPMVYIFNKIDLLPIPIEKPSLEEMGWDAWDYTASNPDKIEEAKPFSLAELTAEYYNKPGTDAVFVSATKRERVADLRELVYTKVLKNHLLIYPNWLKDSVIKGKVEKDEDYN